MKQKTSVDISVTVKAHSTLRLRSVIIVDIEGGYRHFIVLRLNSEPSLFGIPYEDHELVEDYGVMIPKVLLQMKQILYENEWLGTDGVFQIKGSEEEMYAICVAFDHV